jgi:CBS domain-containing protein
MIDLKARDIMLKKVITIGPDEKVASAKLIMTRKGIGGLPVIEGEKLTGIITHRDIILAGDEVLKLKIRDIMTKNVKAVREDTPLKEIVKLMKDKGYQRIPVVKDKKLVGLITQSSIINAIADLL